MRSLLLPLALLVFLSSTSAQDVLDKIARDCCPCVTELKTDSSDQLATKMGLCMLSSALPYKKELKKKYGVDLNDINDENGETFGQMLALHLATQCPGFTELALRLASEGEDTDASAEQPPPPPPVATKTISGVVQETHPAAFLTVLVRADDGTTYELLLLDHVANAERVYLDPAKARGLSASWTYEEREFLDPYSRSYKTYRVIRNIEVRD